MVDEESIAQEQLAPKIKRGMEAIAKVARLYIKHGQPPVWVHRVQTLDGPKWVPEDRTKRPDIINRKDRRALVRMLQAGQPKARLMAGCAICGLAFVGPIRHMWNGMLKASEHGERRVHPTQKPVALASFVFSEFGKPSDVIYDPFLGSGISVIAAERLGDRSVIGCELSPEYIDVVMKRWEDETGQEAALLYRVSEEEKEAVSV